MSFLPLQKFILKDSKSDLKYDHLQGTQAMISRSSQMKLAVLSYFSLSIIVP